MTTKTIPLIKGHFYHIYNRGINSCNIFNEPENYEHFLRLYYKHINPIAETYAWVLMPNHFHLLVQITNPSGFKNLTGLEKPPHQHFSNLFNAYTKAFNKRYNRHGSLFERPFKRKIINTDKYLQSVLLYIHNNPVHHGFCEHPINYGWSSYLSCISNKPTKLKREEVKSWFVDEPDFENQHNKPLDDEKMSKWLEL